jgi:hypothetical protein
MVNKQVCYILIVCVVISFYFVTTNQILEFYCLNIITACTEEGRTATGGREKGDDFVFLASPSSNYQYMALCLVS